MVIKLWCIKLCAFFWNTLYLQTMMCYVLCYGTRETALYCVGAAFTRFQTLRLQKVFPAVLADQLISYGSCQFPTLGFVVERYKQVQAFVPEPFWKLRGMKL